MATPKRLPSGAWRVQASSIINGRSVRKSFTAATPAKALTMAEDWQERSHIINTDAAQLKINDAITEYINIKSNILSPSTIAGYEKIQRNYIADISDMKINNLSFPVLQKWVNGLSKNLSPKTVKDAYSLVRAVVKGFAPQFMMPDITLPQAEKVKSNALSKKEISILLKGIQGHKIEVPILLALWLGLRRSEIMALEWSDIDFEKMTISINKALVYGKGGYITKETKTTDSERTLKLPLYIADKIKLLDNKGKKVFESLDPNRCTKVFPKICQELGIKRYRFHDLRHSMATVGVSLNIADKLVMARGGWNNISTLKNIYQAVLDDDINMADSLYDTYFTHLLEA